jgi:hypothetical protein
MCSFAETLIRLDWGMGVTIPVAPGWVTTILHQQPPTEPTLALRGEGILRGSPDAWKVAGQAVSLGPDSQWIGDANEGDLVSFTGQKLKDGTMRVDRLEKLMPLKAHEFSLTAPLEAAASNALVAGDTLIAVDEKTVISSHYTAGVVATIEGLIQNDQTC